MKTLIMVALFALATQTTIGQQITTQVEPSNDIQFSFVRQQDPSWLYTLTASQLKDVTVQVCDMSNKVLHTYAQSAKVGSLNKLSVAGTDTTFYVVILQDNKEVYRKLFTKSSNK